MRWNDIYYVAGMWIGFGMSLIFGFEQGLLAMLVSTMAIIALAEKMRSQ